MKMNSAQVLLALLAIAVSVHAQGPGICAAHIGVDNQTITFPPNVMFENSGFLSADRLTLVVRVSTWFDEARTQLEFATATSDEAALQPASAPTQWVEVAEHGDDCYTAYELDIPWADMWTNDHGGMDRDADTDPDFIVFTGTLQIDTTKTITVAQYGTEMDRTVHEEIPFIVRFKKTVSVISQVQVFAEVALEAIVMSQLVTANTDAGDGEALATTAVELATILQYPFKMDTTSITVTTDTVELQTDLAIANSVDCADNGGACLQQWTMDIFPRVCELDGSFTITFTNGVICQASAAANCPLDDATNDAQLTVVLDSAHFCSEIVEDIELTAQMSTWGDVDLTVSKDDFLIGQRIYFQAVATSTKATIINTEVVTMTTSLPLALSLYNKELSEDFTADGDLAGIVIETAGVPDNEGRFSMLINLNTFPVDALGNIAAEVHAVLEITFADASSVLLKKSFRPPQPKKLGGVQLLQEDPDSQDIGVSGDVSITDPNAGTTGTEGTPAKKSSISTQTIVFALVGVCAALLMLVIVAGGVKYYKRSQRETAIDRELGMVA